MGVGIGIVVRGAPAGVLVGGRAERSRGWGGMCMLTFANRVSLLRGWPADTYGRNDDGGCSPEHTRPPNAPASWVPECRKQEYEWCVFSARFFWPLARWTGRRRRRGMARLRAERATLAYMSDG